VTQQLVSLVLLLLLPLTQQQQCRLCLAQLHQQQRHLVPGSQTPSSHPQQLVPGPPLPGAAAAEADW
jgi:hypothetical protein